MNRKVLRFSRYISHLSCIEACQFVSPPLPSQNLEPRSPSTFSPALHHASVVEVDDVDKDSDDSASGDEGKGNSDSDSDHESLLSSGSAQLKKKSSKKKKRKEKSKKEFPWKEGPSPPPLPSRPSLGLIRQGQVRIMSKALLMSCPEGVDGEEDSGDTTGKVRVVERGAVGAYLYAGEEVKQIGIAKVTCF